MRKLWLLGVIVLVGIVMTACGSSNDSPTAEVPTPIQDGFTAEMLDASPTYYVTYPGDNNGSDLGTTQETYAISGTGPYTVTITLEYFDASNAFVSSETFNADLTLNQDGTLTATGSDFVSTETLISETSTYLVVDGVEDADTWSHLWYFAKPAGWLSQSSDTGTTGFTAQMLDASPTYYVTWSGDNNGSDLGTTQETIVISGTGFYTATVTDEYFDASNAFVSSETYSVDLTLNQDGTLTATGSDFETTLTLTSETSTYLVVDQAEVADTWSDLWYFGQPAGWMSAPVYVFDTVFLQYRSFESADPRHAVWVSITKDSVAIQEADVADIWLYNSTGTEIIPTNSGFENLTFVNVNCRVEPCTSNLYTSSGFWGHIYTAIPADIYSVEVDVAGGQSLSLDINYSGQLRLPLVTSASMQSAWVGNDLVLSWTNPSGAANWPEVDQLLIVLYDGTGATKIYVSVSPSAETVTINQNILTQAAGLGDGTLSQWQVQTRAYDANKMNFARGYSNKVAIAVP